MHISYELFIIPVIVDILEFFFSTKFIMSLYSVYIHEYTNTVVLFILVFVF